MSQQKKQTKLDYLIQQLAKELGFEDGISDVLEHLLMIESEQDLLDYLAQLLGSDKKEFIKTYVNDVGRYHRGEDFVELLQNTTTNDDDERKQPAIREPTKVRDGDTTKSHTLAAKESVSIAAVSTTAMTAAAAAAPAAVKQKISSSKNTINNSNSSARVMAANSQNSTKASKKQQQKQQQNKSSNYNSDKKQQSQKQTSDTIVNESGKKDSSNTKNVNTAATAVAKVSATTAETIRSSSTETGIRTQPICGCFGTIHNCLSNCLHCGRIACEIEGYDYCPFCSHLVLPISEPPDISQEQLIQAWNLKERLLQYDRELTQRTTIIDDQEDYYNTSTSVWVSDDERLAAIELENKRSEEIHQRNKMTLNIAFD